MYPKHTYILVILAACCVLCLSLQAQDQSLLSMPGRKENYSGKEGGPNMLNNSGLDAATLNTMKTKLLALTAVAESCPGFKEPKGFNLRVQISADKPSPYHYPQQNALTGMSWMAIHEFYRNDNGKVEENPETGIGMTIKINDLMGLFPDQFNNDCDEFELPRFFLKKGFAVSDSTAQYLELADGRRVITNGRPLLVAFTKEQYLLFRLKGKGKQLDDQKKALADAKAMKERAATAPDGHKVTPADRNNGKYSYLLVVYESADKNIDTWRTTVEQTQADLNALNSQLKNMSPAEKHQQAYLYSAVDPYDKTAAGKFMQLAGPGDPGADALVTPNPAYFSKSAPATGIQLITVAKDFDSRFVNKAYEDIIDGVMHCIDYKALKGMIQY